MPPPPAALCQWEGKRPRVPWCCLLFLCAAARPPCPDHKFRAFRFSPQSVCNTLWCSVGNTCHSKLDAAVDGTKCDENKVLPGAWHGARLWAREPEAAPQMPLWLKHAMSVSFQGASGRHLQSSANPGAKQNFAQKLLLKALRLHNSCRSLHY